MKHPVLIRKRLIAAQFFLCAFTFLFVPDLTGQGFSNEVLKEKTEAYKQDIRGPYKSIRWFCNDGTVRDPKDPCPSDIGGIQHATYKDDVEKIARQNHIFLGQILAYTSKEAFWDAANHQSRIKQYQLGRFLARIDNGWINRKGQFYRGSVQIEDEEIWGVDFYHWLLNDDRNLRNHYYLILQSLKDIPHRGDDDLSQLMRSRSKVISDNYPAFMDLRIRIHSNPQPVDIIATEKFVKDHSGKLSSDLRKQFDQLISTLNKFHKPVSFQTLKSRLEKLEQTPPLTSEISGFLAEYEEVTDPARLSSATAEILYQIRENILSVRKPASRLEILDMVNELEGILFKSLSKWEPATLGDLLGKIFVQSKGAAGTGLIEIWEWQKVAPSLLPPNTPAASLANLTEKLETSRGIVEWSSAMAKATYQEEINRYAGFEPLAQQMIDDRIRSSLALPLGKSVGKLGAFIAEQSALSNQVLNLTNQSTVRGLNPGYAMGELVVVSGPPESVEVENNKIYLFDRAPSDLKPVAGIATVSEGNLVSHVQLLARNLGIPNAAISDENIRELKAYDGQQVFYAVSNKGNVIMKPADQMSREEKSLFAKKVRKEDLIEVPVGTIRLDRTSILNLREVDGDDSGKLCGPKAANLGQLKSMYPDRVVEGFVIPFGIFRQHMDQPMPGQDRSYWQFLNDMFQKASEMRAQGTGEKQVEAFQLLQLKLLREKIAMMDLREDFVSDLTRSFRTILRQPIGSIPVFLRSDTNMEDLKDFTGAGLNLTIFNARERDRIIQGIKNVWASPYTERSFKWRQKYLLNPENVFPSILVIPSVDVDYSGVLITKGLSTGNDSELTVAFSRGAGGAVDGQAAETYVIDAKGKARLLSPAREATFNILPFDGGTGKKAATFDSPVLNEKNLEEIYQLAGDVKANMAKRTRSDYKGAYDIELGFKDDNLWLFQIRPFVENKNALASDYLQSITPVVDNTRLIPLTAIL